MGCFLFLESHWNISLNEQSGTPSILRCNIATVVFGKLYPPLAGAAQSARLVLPPVEVAYTNS